MPDQIIVAQPAPVPAKKTSHKSTLATKLKEKLKAKGQQIAKKNGKHKMERWADAGAAFVAPVALGGVSRLVADSAEKNAKADINTPEGREAIAAARDKAKLPHIKFAGVDGTYGVLLAVAGLATGSPAVVAGGASLMGSEVGMRLAGQVKVDARAQKLRDMNAGKISGTDPDDVAGDDVAGEPDEVGAIRQPMPQAAMPPPQGPAMSPADFWAMVNADLAGLDDGELNQVAAGAL